MADWSYTSPELKDIKKCLALRDFEKASEQIKTVYLGDSFKELAKLHFGKEEALCNTFLKWSEYIEFKFVNSDYKEEWGEGGARGNVYTLYGDFFIAFVSNNEDIFSMLIHEYLHHVLDRILWNKITNAKNFFTVKERNFMEDMYVNAWIANISKEIAEKWQLFLVNHDMFHGLIFSEQEEKYNSLLTEKPLPCNIPLEHLYQNLREENVNLLEPRHFAYFTSHWSSILSEEKDIKQMINSLQINKEEWSHEVCTPCQEE